MKTELKVLLLKGLPASGKSTYAQSLVEQGWVRTNKDTIREQLFPNYTRKDEKKVVKERNEQIVQALLQNKNVVVDDTNLNPVHTKEIASLAREHGAVLEIEDSFLQVPIDVCIERDKKRDKSVGEQVIRDMFHTFIRKPATALEYNPELPMAIIVDIDGTLAHNDGRRGWFEWSKVGGDTADAGVSHLVDSVNYLGYAKVFIFSGRDEICRPETEEWLERNSIEYELLAMRPKDSNNDDTEVKETMLLEHVVGKYNVLFVVDDRPKVCRMWRDTFGLRVLQVGDPHWEF